LTDDEKECLKKINNEVYSLDKPLPITRIKNIYVLNRKVDSKNIQKSLKDYNMGYISEKLFESFPKGNKKFIQYSLGAHGEYEVLDHSKSVLEYDKMMGFFASIKNTNFYYTNKNNIYQNYSDHYFNFYVPDAVGATDKKIINTTQWIKENFFYRSDIGKKLILQLNSTDYIDEEFLTIIIDMIGNSNSEVKNKLEILRDDPLEKKEILYFFKEYQEPIYYYISLLFIYGKKGSHDKYAFKENILQEVPYDKAENTLALFGLYYGYTSLPASEKIDIEDKEFKKIVKDDKFNIKFKLDSQLDYLLVESIYQYTFNNKKENIEVDYLKEIFDKKIKKKPVKLPISQEFKRWYKIEIKNKVLDIEEIKIRKLDWEEFIKDKINKYSDTIQFGKDYLLSFIDKNYQELIRYSKDGKPVKPYAEKEDFIQRIKEEKNKNKQNEIFKVFDIDKK
jgi:hypothetical protein